MLQTRIHLHASSLTDWQFKASVCGKMGYLLSLGGAQRAPEKNKNNYLKNTNMLLFA